MNAKLKIQKKELESQVAVLTTENNHRAKLLVSQDKELKVLDRKIADKKKDLESERGGLVKEKESLEVATGEFKDAEEQFLGKREDLNARELTLEKREYDLVAQEEDSELRGARVHKDEENATDVNVGLNKREDALVAKELRLDKQGRALELREKNLAGLEVNLATERKDFDMSVGAFNREREGMAEKQESMSVDVGSLDRALAEYAEMEDVMADKRIEERKEAVRLQEEREALEDIAESIKIKQGAVAKGEIALASREKDAEARDLDLNLKEAELLQRNKRLEVKALTQKG